MPAWTFKGHLVAVAPGRLIDDAANAQAINGDEPINAGVIPEEGSHAPQVSEFLFTHGSDEHDIADRLDVAAVERLNEREESREPSRIISDARGERRPVTLFDGHIRALREHGVKMGGDDELGLAGGAFADSNNVALLVEGCISEPDLP